MIFNFMTISFLVMSFQSCKNVCFRQINGRTSLTKQGCIIIPEPILNPPIL